MLRLDPPDRDPDFAASDAVKRAKEAVRISIGNQQKPTFGRLWGKYKDVFAEAQHGRCGFCEAKVIGFQNGDVEHFRPKGAIWKLKDDPDTWGSEIPHRSTIKGREHNTVRTFGYWWLAYDWDNYLLSCSTCNSVYKASFFPVVADAYKTGPRSKKNDRPVLLNPFRGPRPGTHLTYDEIGSMTARNGSRTGRETIVYLGLNRTGLRQERIQIALRVMRALRDLVDGTVALKERAVDDLHEMGREGNMYAGMVRIMFEQNTQTKWTELEQLIGAP